MTAETDDVPFPSWEAWNRIRGLLPPDRELYESQKRFAAAHITFRRCVDCDEPFSDTNCRSEAGWQETQISGLCERCFDEITVAPEDEPDEDFDPYEAAGESRFGLPGGGTTL